jgi:hypothetical protein
MNDTTPQPEGAVALRPRRAGELLGVAFELYQRHLLALAAIAAVVVVPLGVLNWQQRCRPGCRITVLDGVAISTSFWGTIAGVLAAVAVPLTFAVLLAVATRAVAAELTGDHPGLWRSYRSGLGRPRTLLQVGTLVVGSIAAIWLAVTPAILLSDLDGPLPHLAMVANLALVWVAGLYLGVRLAASIPAAAVEGGRWSQALSRSWSLAAGHWGHVLATLLLAALVWGLVGSLVSVLVGSVVGLLVAVLTGSDAGAGWLAQRLVQGAVLSLGLPYFLVVWVLLYLDLRARKEHLDLDTLRAELRGSEA